QEPLLEAVVRVARPHRGQQEPIDDRALLVQEPLERWDPAPGRRHRELTVVPSTPLERPGRPERETVLRVGATDTDGESPVGGTGRPGPAPRCGRRSCRARAWTAASPTAPA